MLKLVLFSTFLVACLSAPQNQYYQYKTYPGVESQARTLREHNEVNPDGSYAYGFETDNGIAADQQGHQEPVGNNYGNSAQGGFRWTSPEGVVVQIAYVADANGYQPAGDAIPTSPPIPEAILRSIDYINRVRSTNQYRQNNNY